MNNIPVELNDIWKQRLGDNIQGLPEYEFRALGFAETYGVLDYVIKDNMMLYIRKYPNEGIFKHFVNLDTMQEIVKPVKNNRYIKQSKDEIER